MCKNSCERWPEEALPDEENADVTGRESGGVRARLLRLGLQSAPAVMLALDPSGNASARLSRNCCALLSGHTSSPALHPHLPLPPPATPVPAPSGNACDLLRVIPALTSPVIRALSLFLDSCVLPSGCSRDRHDYCGRLRSCLCPRVVVVGHSPLHPCRRPLR